MPLANRLKYINMILIVCLVILFPRIIYSQNIMQWALIDFPPYYIFHGKEKGTGRDERLSRLIQKHLEEYQHQELVMPAARLFQRMKAGNNICVLSLYQTPQRSEYICFSSLPSTIGLPLGVTIKRDKAGLFNQNIKHIEPVSLADLLNNHQLRLGIAKGRSYTARADALIKKYGGPSNIHVRAGRDVYHGLFKMLMNDRLDYIIGYPDEVVYIARSFGTVHEILNLPVKEIDQFSLGYMGCPNNRWGREAVRKLDRVLRKIRPTAEYREIIESWLDEGSCKRLRKIYRSHFLNP